MAVLNYRFKAAPTTVSGAWSDNTESMVGALCRQVYVKSATTTTTFTVNITDKDDVVIYTSDIATGGILNDVTPFPIEGVVTVSIASASTDEAFSVLCVFSDK